MEVYPPTLLACLDESGLPEDRQMSGDGRWRQSQQFGDLAEAQFACAADRQQRPQASLIRQGGGDGEKVVHMVRHFAN